MLKAHPFVFIMRNSSDNYADNPRIVWSLWCSPYAGTEIFISRDTAKNVDAAQEMMFLVLLGDLVPETLGSFKSFLTLYHLAQ